MMKTKLYIRYRYMGLLAASLLLVSCKEWTDIQPRIELRDDMVFSNETSVEEALNGVYAGMTQSAGYGREMTWGLVDAMGGVYDPAMLRDYEVQAMNGSFEHISTQTVIEGAWNNTYRCIAEGNHFIARIDNADPNIFTGANQALFKGEALALRAMLHFDLLRLFGPTVSSPDWETQPVLPYVTTYSSQITPRTTAEAIISRILEDLSTAETLLMEDPILENISLEALRARKVRLNYYAVKALQARIYQWIGDDVNALAAAQVVLGVINTKFPWTSADEIQSTGGQPFDYILASQNVFSLYVNKLGEYTQGLLINIPRTGSTSSEFAPHYSISEAQRQAIYEASGPGVTDYRYMYMTGIQTFNTSSTTLFKKLHQTTHSTLTGSDIAAQPYAANRVPLIKTSEMFYIAAACLANTDPAKAIELLNTVRAHRGIASDLPTQLSSTEILAEVRKEYIKEFPCEGQIFFYKKRTGELNFAWPLPQRELEYGL